MTHCGRFQPDPFWDSETLKGGGCTRVMSAANSTLKEEYGNRERFERVACRSFDHLSVTLERGEAWVCVFSCAGWVSVGFGPGGSVS